MTEQHNPENDAALRLKLLQAEQNISVDYPDRRRGMRCAPCGCIVFGALALPLLKISTGWGTFALILLFAAAGAVLTGLAAAYRPGR